MRRIIMGLGLALGLISSSVVAQAANLTDINGDVRVNGGDGFKVVAGSVNVNVGDIVMTGPNASAKIVYSADYSVAVLPGRIKVVAKNGERAQKLAQLRSTAMRQSAAGGGPQCLPGVPLAYCVVGGVVAAGVVVGVIVANDNKDKPVSR